MTPKPLPTRTNKYFFYFEAQLYDQVQTVH